MSSFSVKLTSKTGVGKWSAFASSKRERFALIIDKYVILMHAKAVELVAKGPKTGRRYGNHQASAPGEAPATDLGGLLRSIVIASLKRRNPNSPAAYSARAPYAADLELGTKNMAKRPFMLAAYEFYKKPLIQELRAAGAKI